ncbi:MAG: cysteine--tRNA ligase, partial [Bacilli bacterium]|nr:cysteine--tRNA ligase [Bacilli bacterium]
NELFKEAISNDLNTANAITILYDVLKDNEISNSTKIALVKSFDKVFSLDLIKEKEIDKELEDKVNKLIEERNNYKVNKDYENADRIRSEIEALGVTIKDTREGTIIIWE